jgi:hypothetical protein
LRGRARRPLATHHLDQDGELELAPAGDLEGFGGAGVLDPDGRIDPRLPGQPLLELARGTGTAGGRRLSAA